MIFFLILIGVLVAWAILVATRQKDECGIVCLLAVLFLVIFLAILLASIAFKGEVRDMRENPEMYTIFDKHRVNESIQSARRFQGTIFSFYNGFDLTYIEEN